MLPQGKTSRRVRRKHKKKKRGGIKSHDEMRTNYLCIYNCSRNGEGKEEEEEVPTMR